MLSRAYGTVPALIYESILALAAADSISAEEEPLMLWLQETWEIQ